MRSMHVASKEELEAFYRECKGQKKRSFQRMKEQFQEEMAKYERQPA